MMKHPKHACTYQTVSAIRIATERVSMAHAELAFAVVQNVADSSVSVLTGLKEKLDGLEISICN